MNKKLSFFIVHYFKGYLNINLLRLQDTQSIKVYFYGQTPISFGERLFPFVYVYKQYTNDSNLTHDIYEQFSEQYEHLLSKEVLLFTHFLEKASICRH